MTTSNDTLAAPAEQTKMVDRPAMKERALSLSFVKDEPIGTITNVFFLIAAVFIAHHGQGPFTALVAALTLLFVGSTAFHANGSREDVIPHWADVGFLYTVAAAIVFHVWGELAWVLMVGMIIAGVFTLLWARSVL